jgi:hypothetical protein
VFDGTSGFAAWPNAPDAMIAPPIPSRQPSAAETLLRWKTIGNPQKEYGRKTSVTFAPSEARETLKIVTKS